MKAFPYSVMTYNPNHPDSPRYTTTWHEGMDLRDYFAAAALQGLIAGCYAGNNAGFTVDGNVYAAYEYADAMLKAREK